MRKKPRRFTRRLAPSVRARFEPLVDERFVASIILSCCCLLATLLLLLVLASIGQHIRHSNDHIEKAIFATSHPDAHSIRYDVRERGCPDENDMVAAEQRIQRVIRLLEKVESSQEYIPVIDHRIEACFMLSGDEDTEFPLPSTAARELGFAAHHAIHHLALVRIIALNTAQLSASDLPPDFGRAPSTVIFEQHEQEAT